MKLTDADIGALERALERAQGGIIYGSRVALAQRAYLAGKRAGREDMRERAAKLIQQYGSADGCECVHCTNVAARAAAIRALGVDDE